MALKAFFHSKKNKWKRGDKTNLENLHKGQVVKNYIELCKLLGEDVKCCAGQSKICQLKDFKRYFEWEKDGQKFIISDIYDKPLPKIDRRCNNFLGHYTVKVGNYLVQENDNNAIGVYKIQLNNMVYIGSTINGFRKRYVQHVKNRDGFMPHTQKMLENGATFEIIWKSIKNETEEQIRNMEQKYIDEYTINGFDVVNIRKEVIIPGKKKKVHNRIIRVLETDYENALHILNKHGIKTA